MLSWYYTNQGEASLGRAYLYESKEAYGKAISEYTKAAGIFTESTEPGAICLYHAIRCCKILQNVKEATNLFNKFPENPDAIQHFAASAEIIGDLHMSRKQYDQAYPYFYKVFVLYFQNRQYLSRLTVPLTNLMTCAIHIKQYAVAIHAVLSLIKMHQAGLIHFSTYRLSQLCTEASLCAMLVPSTLSGTQQQDLQAMSSYIENNYLVELAGVKEPAQFLNVLNNRQECIKDCVVYENEHYLLSQIIAQKTSANTTQDKEITQDTQKTQDTEITQDPSSIRVT